MSSLAAVQADGYYRPPEGKEDQVHHSHPLGNRARKAHLGIIIVRFEMPVNVWCEGCGEHIAQGVRFNAEKKKCGTYFTTDIFEFQMNCHLCGQRFIIKTDPANRDYEFVAGVRRKIETFDAKDIGTREIDDKEQALMRMDAMKSLENKEQDARGYQLSIPVLNRLKDIQDRIYKDEGEVNRLVRGRLRVARKAEAKREAKAKEAGLNITLLPTTKSDIRKSHSVLFEKKSKAEVNAKLQEIKAISDSVFKEEDRLKDYTLKQCIANGVNLKLFKKEEKEEKKVLKPKIVAKAKKVKNTLGLIPSSYGDSD